MSPSTVDLTEAEEAEGLAGLAGALQEWHATKGADPQEVPDWLPQMRSLVQAGVPKVRLIQRSVDPDSMPWSWQGVRPPVC